MYLSPPNKIIPYIKWGDARGRETLKLFTLNLASPALRCCRGALFSVVVIVVVAIVGELHCCRRQQHRRLLSTIEMTEMEPESPMSISHHLAVRGERIEFN